MKLQITTTNKINNPLEGFNCCLSEIWSQAQNFCSWTTMDDMIKQ